MVGSGMDAHRQGQGAVALPWKVGTFISSLVIAHFALSKCAKRH